MLFLELDNVFAVQSYTFFNKKHSYSILLGWSLFCPTEYKHHSNKSNLRFFFDRFLSVFIKKRLNIGYILSVSNYYVHGYDFFNTHKNNYFATKNIKKPLYKGFEV